MIRLKIFYLLILALTVLFNACKREKLKIDVSGIEANVETFRIEKELFSYNQDYERHRKLHKELGDFYKKYIEIMIKAGPVDDSLTLNGINQFTQDAEIKEVYADVASAYKDLALLDRELSSAFKHYSYYFPNKLIPEVVTYISGFNYAVAASDSVLGIGLDMYLGKDYKYYGMIGFPDYKTISMSREYILPDAIKGWVATEFEFDPIGKDMLNQIIHHGKIMFILDALLPDLEDTLKIAYSKEQLEWCKNNEANVWAHFIDKQLLFTTNSREIMSYINDGPFTNGLPRESPSKVGVWLGWQIVRAYMEKQDSVDLQKLLDADAQEILKESKYKPRR